MVSKNLCPDIANMAALQYITTVKIILSQHPDSEAAL